MLEYDSGSMEGLATFSFHVVPFFEASKIKSIYSFILFYCYFIAICLVSYVFRGVVTVVSIAIVLGCIGRADGGPNLQPLRRRAGHPGRDHRSG